MSKIITYDAEAREKLLNGINAVANAVRVTVGPRGRNAILGKQYGSPQVVNDGVTIAKEIELKDPLENAGAQLLKDVSQKTNDVAGDGTTTATILAQSIIKQGLIRLNQGCNPIQMKDGIEDAAKAVTDFIESKAVQVDETTLEQVATVSSGNNAAIGKLISDAIKQVGENGVVTVEESSTIGTSLKSAEGMQLAKGYLSHYFVTDPERMECVLEKPVILCVNKKINLVNDLIPILDYVVKAQLSLFIVAEDVEGEALAALVVNSMRKVLRACAIKSPGFGETRRGVLEDLCALTGGQLWTEELGIPLDAIQPNFFGKASRVVVKKDETTIVVDNAQPNETLQNHIASLKQQYESTEVQYDKEKLQERIARLTGGVAVIQVGAATEIELKDKKLRIEDALNATRAAQAEGVVAGGGYTLLEAQEACKRQFTVEDYRKDYEQGYDLLIDALDLPAKLIAENAGKNGEDVVAKCKQEKVGYNALTDKFEDLATTGVIDPAKVTRSALQNAASIAGMLLTTHVAIVDEPVTEEANAFQPAGSPMMM